MNKKMSNAIENTNNVADLYKIVAASATIYRGLPDPIVHVNFHAKRSSPHPDWNFIDFIVPDMQFGTGFIAEIEHFFGKYQS